MNGKTLITIIALVVVLALSGWLFLNKNPKTVCAKSNINLKPTMPTSDIPRDKTLPTELRNKVAVVQTNCGNFTVEFFDNDAPLAVQNFIRLAEAGKYDGAPFHRVIKGFMVQGGDYTKGDGTGGASIWGQPFPDELDPAAPSFREGYKRGVVAMANAGPNTNGSQFFVMQNDYPLPNAYTIFGRVIAGLETIDKMVSVPVLANSYGELSVPTENIIIQKIIIQNK